MPDKVTYTVLSERELRFPESRQFALVAMKKVNETDAVFISISRGFYNTQGRRNFKGSISFPPALKSEIIKAISDMAVE